MKDKGRLDDWEIRDWRLGYWEIRDIVLELSPISQSPNSQSLIT